MRRLALSRLTMVALLLACSTGLGLRVAGVSTSPLTFHSARQYLSLRVARATFLAGRDVPEWRAQVANASIRAEPQLEPRIMEAAAVLGYWTVGGERLWMGGLLSSVLWVMGGVCLFLIARRLASDLAGAVAVGIYLFLPYSIIASRSFQPDPAMVAVMLAAILAVLRYLDEPGGTRLVGAGLLAGTAVLIKPTVCFALVGAFSALVVQKRGLAGALRSRHTWAFVLLTVLPAGSFYAYGLVVGGSLRSSASASFLPALWLEAGYWTGWLDLIDVAVGIVFAAIALVVAALARRPPARALMAGLWSGYAVYGLVFSYHIHTHDYYHLQLVPLVGLGLGLGVDAMVSRLRASEITAVMKGALALASIALCLSMAHAAVRAARPRPESAVRAWVRQAETIGDLVSHSTEVVTMAVAAGRPLEYHGEFAGTNWPNSGDLRLARLEGRPRPSASALLEEMARSGAEWFVITDFPELKRQPEVRRLLDERAGLVSETEDHLVYDLRHYVPAGGRPG